MMQLVKDGKRGRAGTFVICALVMLMAGCQNAGGFNPFNTAQTGAASAPRGDTALVRLVERDVEAPEAFQKTDMGLWDGRPSLGGVWVAHPDVNEPERVIIRNTANSNFVIGALFRRERENPGPVFQVSSDAAAALGMLAGAPAQLNVTALRREEAPAEEPAPTEAPPAPQAVETTALDPVAGAAAAIEAAEETSAEATPSPQPAASPSPRAPASRLEKPFIQIGIFSIEQNAQNTATAMRQNGMVPTVMKQSSQGKTFWRVIVGPATSRSERAVLLEKIKGVGFEDAYPVTN
jgi:rare lipoprotein A